MILRYFVPNGSAVVCISNAHPSVHGCFLNAGWERSPSDCHFTTNSGGKFNIWRKQNMVIRSSVKMEQSYGQRKRLRFEKD